MREIDSLIERERGRERVVEEERQGNNNQEKVIMKGEVLKDIDTLTLSTLSTLSLSLSVPVIYIHS